LDWIVAQSRTVALCLQFIGLLHEGDEYATSDAVENVPHGPYAWGIRVGFLPLKEGREGLRSGVASTAIIRRSLCDFMTQNISGVRRWVLTDPYASRGVFFSVHCNHRGGVLATS